MKRPALQNQRVAVLGMAFWARMVFGTFEKRAPGACFSKGPNLFGWHSSLCIFKTKMSRVTKLCSYLNFYSLYNIWKDQLYRISGSEFYEWLFGPVKFTGLLRNETPQVWRPLVARNNIICHTWRTKLHSYQFLSWVQSKHRECLSFSVSVLSAGDDQLDK